MSKAFAPTEKYIETLLTKMGADVKPYPDELLAARRTAYLSQVAVLVGSGFSPTNGSGSGSSGAASVTKTMTPLMKVVLTTLIAGNIALATYLAVTVYENWDRVQEYLFGAPVVSETSAPPIEAPVQEPEIIISPESPLAPTSTPETTIIMEDPGQAEGDSVNSQQESTPIPAGDDQPGLRLGQTPHSPDTPPGQNNQNDKQGDQSENKDKQK